MCGFCKINNMAVWLKVLMMWFWSGTAVFTLQSDWHRYGRLEGEKGSRSASRLIISAYYFYKIPGRWSNSHRVYVSIRSSTFEQDETSLRSRDANVSILLCYQENVKGETPAPLGSALRRVLLLLFLNWLCKHMPYFTEKQQGHV